MRLIACLGLCLLLSGCSGLSDMFSADGDDAVQSESAAADAAPADAAPRAAQPADDGFCRNVAADDATGHGFDQATQTRVAQQSYAQCKAVFGR